MSSVSRLLLKLNDALERRFVFWATLVIALVVMSSLCRAFIRKMWVDEFFTLHIALLKTPAEIIRASIAGADAAPPLYAILVHYLLPIAPSEAVATRLPSTLAFGAMLVCLLAFCRRRLPAAYCFAAVFLTCCLCIFFRSEGRAYGLVLMGATAALLSWQYATEGKHRAGCILVLALSLDLMTAAHFYSIFYPGAFLAGELVRWHQRRRPDWAILAALSSPLLVLALHYPIIRTTRKFQEHHWSPASVKVILETYTTYFVPAIVAGVAVLLAIYVVRRFGGEEPEKPGGFPLHEWVVLACMPLMPLLAGGISLFTTHVFVPRYTLWSHPGFAALVVSLVWLYSNRGARAGVAMTLGLGLLLGAADTYLLLRQQRLTRAEDILQQLKRMPPGNEPIVIGDHHAFMEMSYYAPANLRERLVFPLSIDLDRRYLNTDSGALVMKEVPHITRLNVQDFDRLFALREFTLAALPWDYIPQHMKGLGYDVIKISQQRDAEIFRVRHHAPAMRADAAR